MMLRLSGFDYFRFESKIKFVHIISFKFAAKQRAKTDLSSCKIRRKKDIETLVKISTSKAMNDAGRRGGRVRSNLQYKIGALNPNEFGIAIGRGRL